MSRFFVSAIVIALVAGTAVTAQEKQKAYFTVISQSEPGLAPHSAVLMEYDGKQVWLGFKPKNSPRVVGESILDDTDLTKWTDKYVRFEVDPDKLKEAEKAVRKEFDGKTYKATVLDCVSLSVAFAKQLDLEVPGKPNLIPANLVDNLKKLNEKKVQSSGSGKDTLPWVKK